MSSDSVGISIYYASHKWPGLISYIRSVFQDIHSDLQPFVFFNTVKGDSLRLIVSTSAIPVSNIVVLLDNYIKRYPSRRSRSNLKMGETLWMNYPNNQIFMNNFKFDMYPLPMIEGTKSNIIYSFSKAISCFLLKSDVSGSNVLSYFMQLIILINRCLEVKNVPILLTCVIESVEDDSEIKQREKEWIEIRDYALFDSNANAVMIGKLIAGNSCTSARDRLIVELSETISGIVSTPSKRIYYDTFINQIISHLGIDYRKQLYVFYMLRYYYLKIQHS